MADYMGLSFGDKKVQCPYYNNRRGGIRAGLRPLIGKGSPDEITEEVILIALKSRENIKGMDEKDLKRFIVDRKIGIDCSGLAYYILDAESRSKNLGSLKKNLRPVNGTNFLRKLICKIRPVESAGVTSFSSEKNSKEIKINDARPGDFIAMLNTGPEKNYHHILVLTETMSENGNIKQIKYVHSYAWPEDGKYGHGVREGCIEITDVQEPIQKQIWTEQSKSGDENITQRRAIEAGMTSVRRLNWFH